jgi:hypothetical protein
MGGFAVGGDVAVVKGVIGETSNAAVILDGVGAMGWSLGSIGTILDTGNDSHGGG